MSKGGCENKSAIVYPFYLSFQKFTKIPTYHWSKNNWKWGGKSHCVRNTFSSSCWPQLLAPNYLMSFSPAQQLWVFSYNAWRVWRTPDKRSETIFSSSRISPDPSDSQLHVSASPLPSVHLTHFYRVSGQRTGMAIAEAWFLCSVTHFCVVFEVCVWIYCPVGDPNMAPL